jgi:hypothetical protein
MQHNMACIEREWRIRYEYIKKENATFVIIR